MSDEERLARRSGTPEPGFRLLTPLEHVDVHGPDWTTALVSRESGSRMEHVLMGASRLMPWQEVVAALKKARRVTGDRGRFGTGIMDLANGVLIAPGAGLTLLDDQSRTWACVPADGACLPAGHGTRQHALSLSGPEPVAQAITLVVKGRSLRVGITAVGGVKTDWLGTGLGDGEVRLKPDGRRWDARWVDARNAKPRTGGRS